MNGTDLELLERYTNARDAVAFAELVARHRDMVYAACYRVLSSQADAEDSTQECFLRLAHHSESVRASVAGWLHRVAVRTSISAQRKDRTRRRTEREAATMMADASAEPSWDEIKTEVDQAIDRLPDELREPLVLQFLEGARQTAIAEKLGLSQPTVSRKINEGVERLRRDLKRTGLTVSAAGLSALLTTHAVEAAPAALVAALGKIALVGVGTSPVHVGAGGSAIGLGVVASTQAKIACIVAASVAVGAVVQQTTRRPGIAREASATSKEAHVVRPATPIAGPPPVVAPEPDTDEPDGPARAPTPGRPQPEAALAAEPLASPGLPEDAGDPPSTPQSRSVPEMLVQEPEPSHLNGEASSEQTSPEEPAFTFLEMPDPMGRSALRFDDTRLATPAGEQPPPAGGPVEVVDRSGLADGLIALMAGDVLAVAKQAIEETLPDRHIEHIRLVVAAGRPQHENVVTDRNDTIYVRVGNYGMGEAMRGDVGPIALLCEAVADLYNVWRLPGFNRYMAHRYLVPAVVEQLGDGVIVTPHPSPLGADGAEMLQVITQDEYTFVHPYLAAVAALMAIDDKLGLDGFRALVTAVPLDAEDPFAELREAAIEADPQLDAAFAAYDEACRLEPDEDGSCVITSFELEEFVEFTPTHPLRTNMQGLLLDTNPGVKWSFSEDWAAHGSYSLKLEADENATWMALYIRDPDWKFRDLRRFSEFELDLMVEAANPLRVAINLYDHVTDGHGRVQVFNDMVIPGIWHHVAYPLTEQNLRGHQDMDAEYFSGQFRADSASRIYIGPGKPREPITLYVDNLRLRPRDLPEPQGLPGLGR